MTKIFIPLGDSDHYEYLILSDKSQWEMLSQKLGGAEPIGSSWRPVRVTIVRESEHSRTPLKPGDSPYLGTCLVVSEKAARILSSVLQGKGELLPLDCSDGEYFALHVTRVVDALDERSSEITWLAPGRGDSIRKYVFFPDLVKNETIFRIPQLASRTFATDRVLELVTEHGLRGLVFDTVWEQE